MIKTKVISHIKKVDDAYICQSNEEHQEGVAMLASVLADSFGMAEWGRVLGLLHDKGKEKRAFQQHILKESGCQPDIRVEGDYRHAYVGALMAKKLFPQYHVLMDNILAGHHRGLYDYGDLAEAMKLPMPDDVETPNIDAKLSLPSLHSPKDLHHLQRMLYSCLVDADYLDTEAFMMPAQSKLRGRGQSMKCLLEKLENHLEELRNSTPDTGVNRIRNQVQQWCIEQSAGKVDFYSLTVPTGGGKTLASVLWALHHAVKNDLRRIIIAIPYTSIIVQTAAVLKAIFGADNVLEHHSNMEDCAEGNRELRERIRLSTENWDYPIVVTTNVQLFESLFSNRPSDCRKLHNIAKSVLILDEVQTLPLEFLRPIVDTLDTIKCVFGTSILFTTASQPTLTGKIVGTHLGFDALPEIHEIVPQGADLHNRLRRVELAIDNTPRTYDEVAKEIASHHRVLCIVNTRRDAKELYERLPKEGICLHLSRMMCPAHVRQTIQMVKDALKDDSNKIIRVIATQLVEAGVDIDFPVVFRQEAGLDSVLQAAGRCNREGRQDICTTYVFSLQKEHPLPKGFISQTNNARLNMVGPYDWFSPKTMNDYFRQLYARTEDFDKKKIADMLYKPEMEFEEAANSFHLIDDNTTAVIVNWENGMELVEKLKDEGLSYDLMKQLAQYSVSIRQHDILLLQQSGALEEVIEGVYMVSSRAFYDEYVGLITSNQWLEETLIL